MQYQTYQNPVWDGEFADPYVIKTSGGYYAYGTSAYARAPERGGFAFPVLHSPDLTRWTHVGGAIQAVVGKNYWAPAAAERDGRYYLYYSSADASDDTTHRLNVARASHPAGPFEPLGPLLPDQGFSIDADPFCDPVDGRWHVFFATDFFDGRTGTGLAAVTLAETMDRPAGDVVPVLRATADWQIYERDRPLYDRRWPAWHTVEGPSVVWHDGLYYCFYSGGAWHSDSYGVSYSVSSQVMGPYRDEWSAQGPAVLRTLPGKVVGPGHNSVVVGPDGRTEFIVYHAWDVAATARRMCIDPLLWTPDGPRCAGPSTTPQTLRVDADGPP